MHLFQITSFSAKRLRAAYITGEQDDDRVKSDVVDGIVFLTPEILLNDKQWRQLFSTPVFFSTPVYSDQLRALVID